MPMPSARTATGAIAHRRGKAYYLVDSFALHAQRRDQRGELRRSDFLIHKFVHHLTSLGLR